MPGSGGFATVYLGEHLLLKRFSAVKLLRASLVAEEEAAFLNEARLLASLSHPNIIQIQDYIVEDGRPLLIMEYAQGGPIRSCYPPGQPLPLDQLLDYLRQVASAIQYAHDRGVIHRDIKPENLLLDDQGRLKLSDFGLALLAPLPAQLHTQELVGTVFYMSPEQLRGKPTFATDQYALGVVLYEWLSGERPFRGSTAEVIGQHLHAEMPSLLTKRPDLPQEVEMVLRKALAKEPDQRFRSVLDFARAFEAACDADLAKLTPGSLAPQSTPASDPYATSAVSQGTQPAGGQRQIQRQVFVPQHQRSQEQLNRQRMLAKVRSFWLQGVLAQSLQHGTHLVPELLEKPEAVAHPWKMVLQQAGEAPHPVPPGTTITEVFDQLGGELLILGQPGSGKTTLLLELAENLLTRADTGQLELLPVVFNLSSWAAKRRPLHEWLIDELNDRYQVPRRLARTWVEQDQILPLLDGLDEVAVAAQSACLAAINAFRREHGLLPLVMCSRSADYFALDERVQLGNSVEIQPLTPGQVDAYLAGLGQQFAPVRVALKQDQELLELCSTPLMLTILVVAFQDQDLAELLNADTLDLRQRRLFEAYVKRMLERRGGPPPYTPEQITRWLSWLAKSMRKHDQTIFYLERLQLSWLPTARLQGLYHRWAVRAPALLMGGLIGAWIGGLFVPGRLSLANGGFLVLSQTTVESCLFGLLLGWLFTTRSQVHSRLASWGEHLRTGAIFGLAGILPNLALLSLSLLISGPFEGWLAYLITFQGLSWLSFALVGFLSSLLLKRTPTGEEKRQLSRSPGALWRRLTRQSPLRNALIGAGLGLLYGFLSMAAYGDMFGTDPAGNSMFGYVFAQMLSFCTSFGVVSLLATLFIQRAGTGEIQPTETIRWSWRGLLGSFLQVKRLGYALLLGLFYGLLYGLLGIVYAGMSGSFLLTSVLSIAGIVALMSWLLMALFGGWQGEMLDERKLVKSNQGIRRSLLYGLIFGVLSWLVYGAVTWLVRFLASFSPLTQWILPDTWFHSWLLYGLPGALVIGLLLGWWASLKHFNLRRSLRKIDAMPSNYPRFLEYAVERILLRKAGGGYLFIHRLLLDYFASLPQSEKDGETPLS